MALFRVAEFKKKKYGQQFERFAYSGYKIDQNGILSHYKKKVTTKDRRRRNYCEVNRAVGQNDIKGHQIYEEDYVFDYRNNVKGFVRYYDNMGAFILDVYAERIKIPYSVLDIDELSLEIIGNKYE
jgi:hypothetical protein